MQTKPNSFESYDYTCKNHLLPVLGSCKLQKMTTGMINDYLAAKSAAGLANSTLAHHRAIIHSILDLAVKEGFSVETRLMTQHPSPKDN